MGDQGGRMMPGGATRRLWDWKVLGMVRKGLVGNVGWCYRSHRGGNG